jgi:hypothetical protein
MHCGVWPAAIDHQVEQCKKQNADACVKKDFYRRHRMMVMVVPSHFLGFTTSYILHYPANNDRRQLRSFASSIKTCLVSFAG